MEFRILKLNAYIDIFEQLDISSSNLTIEMEQLYDAYDFIVVYCDNKCCMFVEPILTRQNYVCYGYRHGLST